MGVALSCAINIDRVERYRPEKTLSVDNIILRNFCLL